MKRTALALAFAFTVCAAGPAFAQSPPPAGKTDLVITNFGLDSWGTCASGQWVYRFSVGVKNQGTGTWSGAEPAIVVKDMHLPNPDDWGTGLGIDPPLKAGETRQFKVDVLYYAANPAHMTGGTPHPFRASVNDSHAVAESDFTNNLGPGPATWNGMKVIQMGAPEKCPKTITGKPGISTGPATGGRAPAPPTPTRAVPR
jgi:hypothetical protein